MEAIEEGAGRIIASPIAKLLPGILLSVALGAPAAAQAEYRYALVVGPTLSVDGFRPGSLNESGEVVYADATEDFIATSSETIARAGDTIDGELFAAVAAGGGTAIDDEGRVAFRARYGDGDFDAIFTATSVVAKQWDDLTGVTLGFVGPPDIGAGGQVVYEATVCPGMSCTGSAIYLDRAELVRTPVSDGFVELSGVSHPVIDETGRIGHYGYAFLADVSGVYHLTGAGALSRVVHTGESVGAGLVLDNPRGLLRGLDMSARGDVVTTWTTDTGEWLVLKKDVVVARAGDDVGGTVLTEIQSHAPAVDDAGGVVFIARHAGGFGVFTPEAVVLLEGHTIGGETVEFLEGVAINGSGTIAIHVGFESGLDGIVLAVPESNRRLRMTTGSSVAVRQNVDLPSEPFALRLDHRFATTTGTLTVRLGGMVLGSASAPGALAEGLQRSVFPVEGALLGQSGVPLELELDGATGSIVEADNVFAPGLANGTFESGDLTGWDSVLPGGGSLTVVPAPGSLAGALASLLALGVLRARPQKLARGIDAAPTRTGGNR